MKKLSLMFAFVGMFSAASFASAPHLKSTTPQDENKKQAAVKKETQTPAQKKVTTSNHIVSSSKKKKFAKKDVRVKTSLQPASVIENKKK